MRKYNVYYPDVRFNRLSRRTFRGTAFDIVEELRSQSHCGSKDADAYIHRAAGRFGLPDPVVGDSVVARCECFVDLLVKYNWLIGA